MWTREYRTALPVPKLTKIKQNDMNSFMCTQTPTKCMNKQQLMTNVSEKLTIFNIYFSTKQRLGRGKWQIQLTLVPLPSSGKTPFMTNLRLSLAWKGISVAVLNSQLFYIVTRGLGPVLRPDIQGFSFNYIINWLN